ncbi:acyltransferase family protein [Dyadobacter chenhuakuii]|uniref:Acyltransferase family protein n=1 Tax=Dyadobacter chenhuakuii TaxID=2909339 RepID=A0A9X1Q8Y2_9BACT|nr:acyltransferase family protein [Dyadobacter chenhuakuii]MCF2496679.1 acyltransferase family protein [Dyadobacter chenhuakuii]
MQTNPSRAVWLDYLRSFVTLLVVAHHVALAYPTFAYFDATRYIRSTAPIVDPQRWVGMDTFISFNDLFFMPLMFLISGLFVNKGLIKKGVSAYLRDRFIRLGIPFLIAEAVLIPLAYWPSFYQATHSTDLMAFLKDYIITQRWPVGPPWFIWLLLAFDGVAVLIFSSKPTFFVWVGNGLAKLSRHPIRLGAALYGLIALSLIPLSLWVGQYTWVGRWGPFDFQLNRVLFYLSFFLLGSCLGATDWQSYLFTAGKLLGKSWWAWLLSSLICFGLFTLVARWSAYQVKQGHLSPLQGYFWYDLMFVASCLASMSACLSFFKQTIIKPIRSWDSLSANAYGIYVVHYGFVTWFQFGFLGINLPVVLKFSLIFVGALGLSWLTSRLLRQNSVIKQVL